MYLSADLKIYSFQIFCLKFITANYSQAIATAFTKYKHGSTCNLNIYVVPVLKGLGNSSCKQNINKCISASIRHLNILLQL